MKQIFLEIQSRLQQKVPDLNYIDKNWEQLNYDPAPVQFPCVLIDVNNVSYTQMARGNQKAEAEISIILAHLNLIRSSGQAPNKTNAYKAIELLEEIHQALQSFSNQNQFAPLMRIRLAKIMADKDFEVYEMTYKTEFTSYKNEPEKTPVMVEPVIQK